MSFFILSGIMGAILALLVMIGLMRSRMIRRYRLPASFERACESLEAAIRSVPGWGMPIPAWDFHAAVSKKYPFRNVVRKKLFFLCKAQYANRIIDSAPQMGAMMPCSWALYETRSGEVFLSKMNIPLMGKMFAGSIIGNTMGKVGKEEHRMLEELNRLLAATSQTA